MNETQAPTILPKQHSPKVPERIQDLRVACVVDELTEKFLVYECSFINLDANKWKTQIETFQPHILFVESFWNGYKKTWRKKHRPNNKLILVQLINWCKKRGIPTIFWNKEDPIHILTFLSIAFHFDYVFTTDMDCVPLYKRLLKHDRVGVLPFASAIQLFDPIEKYERKNAACFAGSYYAKRIERKKDLEAISDTLIEAYALEIYDRDPYPGNPDYSYPERFQQFIKGSLPVEQIDIAYKSYAVGITMNIVKRSSTMEARRIFELLSCNTLTVSNPCLGIKNLFGDLIIYYENRDQFLRDLFNLIDNEDRYRKTRLLGLRKILLEHTYRERLAYLYEKVFNIHPKSTKPSVAVFSVVSSTEEIERIRQAFDRQNYKNKTLFLFFNPSEKDLKGKDLFSIESFVNVLSEPFDWYALFSPQNYYGRNYLLDLVLAERYVQASAIGKSAYYRHINDEYQFVPGDGMYIYLKKLRLDRALLSPHLLHQVKPKANIIKATINNVTCFSTDPLNFCEGFSGEACEKVEDAQIDTGYSMEDVYQISDSLSQDYCNYSFGQVFTGIDLQNAVDEKPKTFILTTDLLSYFAFYTIGDENEMTRTEIKTECSVKIFSEKEELTNQDIIDIYVNGYFEGDIIFQVIYYNEKNTYVGGYQIFPNASTRIPVIENANYFNFQLKCIGRSQGIIKEMILNPKIERAIGFEGISRTNG